MSDFSFDELQAAHKALSSSRNKIIKARGTLLQKSLPPKSQLTLTERNLDALRVALSLISDELEKISPESNASTACETMSDTGRLAAFEEAYNELTDSLVTIPAQLEKLKGQGKEKTVRYRELLGQKLMNGQIKALFERHGIV